MILYYIYYWQSKGKSVTVEEMYDSIVNTCKSYNAEHPIIA